MKTLSIKKLLTTAVVTFAALTLTACNDSIRTENETAEAYLKINGNTARTVTFAYELGDMTDFVLTGKRTADSDIKHLAAFESFTALLQATIPIDQGAWHSLTLSAYEEQTAFTATVENVTIVSGMNSLTLTLAPDTAATTASTGTVRVTFNIPDSAKVSCVTAGLFDRSTDHAVSGYELEDLSQHERNRRKRGVRDGHCIRHIPALTYTRYGVTLPEENDVEKDGYFLDGWYTDSDYTGERVTELTPALHGDITLYAKWIQGCALYASELDSKDIADSAYGDTYTVRLLGEWTGAELRSLGVKLKTMYTKKITLDMATRTTGITSLYDASGSSTGTFNSCDALIDVLLPDTLETISDYVFYWCNYTRQRDNNWL